MPPHLAGYGHIAGSAYRSVERRRRQPSHNLPGRNATAGVKGTVPCKNCSSRKTADRRDISRGVAHAVNTRESRPLAESQTTGHPELIESATRNVRIRPAVSLNGQPRPRRPHPKLFPIWDLPLAGIVLQSGRGGVAHVIHSRYAS